MFTNNFMSFTSVENILYILRSSIEIYLVMKIAINKHKLKIKEFKK